MRFTEGTLRQAARYAGESTAFAYISRCSSDDQIVEQIYLKLQGRSCLARISAIPLSRAVDISFQGFEELRFPQCPARVIYGSFSSWIVCTFRHLDIGRLPGVTKM